MRREDGQVQAKDLIGPDRPWANQGESGREAVPLAACLTMTTPGGNCDRRIDRQKCRWMGASWHPREDIGGCAAIRRLAASPGMDRATGATRCGRPADFAGECIPARLAPASRDGASRAACAASAATSGAPAGSRVSSPKSRPSRPVPARTARPGTPPAPSAAPASPANRPPRGRARRPAHRRRA